MFPVADFFVRALAEQIRSPTRPNSAGSRVNDSRTVISTVTAATSAMVDRKPMPMTSMPHRAIMTVSPAKNTALPAVPTARLAASRALNFSSRINRRCRFTINSE
ncbi:hypothetical protein D3C81_1863050 [compost metagenome]